jgi:NAD(P) transhydrogenase
MAGDTEEALVKKGIPYVAGRATYSNNARGRIIGDDKGFLKLLFGLEDKKLLGVHVIGERATELVHTGQAVMHFGGGIDDFIEQVFNFPTLGEMFKYAAYDGLGRLRQREKVIAH